MNRGDIVTVDFSRYDPTDKVRPALILQNDRDNARLIQEILDQRVQEVVDQRVQQETRATARRNILAFLEARFGEIPDDLAEQIRSVAGDDRLGDLVRKAASCRDLEEFRSQLET